MMMVLVVFLSVMLMAKGETVLAKTKTVKIDLRYGSEEVERPYTLDKAKKVKITSSKKSVVTAKYKKNRGDRRIIFKGKKKGKATITVKCILKNKKTKILKYKVKVNKSKKVSNKDLAKKAFKIQNKYRKEKGIKALQWSDEVYDFCVYRLKASGYDGHKNIGRDEIAYFGDFALYKKMLLSENMYSGYPNPEDAMRAWKESDGHYENLLSSKHICGAIACSESRNIWCAIFVDIDKNELKNWQDYNIKGITVKRFDSQGGKYISGCTFGYYEVGNRWGSIQSAAISKQSGKKIYLEVGKTYVIYEKIKPNGCDKAERITITVTEDGDSEIILKS